MKKLVSILAALALVPSVATAAKWSSDLSGESPRQEGFASITTTASGDVTYSIMTNGIGVPTRAVILVDGAEAVDLNAEFEFGAASSTVSTRTNLSNLVRSTVALRVEGPDGTIEGPVDLIRGPDVNVNAPQRNFGEVAVGTRAPARRVIVSNDGTENLRVADILIRGANRNQYRVLANTCRKATLAPGRSCALTVTFAPTSTGEKRGLAVVNSSDPGSPLIVQLRGVGI